MPVERRDARGILAALFQKHSSGDRHVFADLRAALLEELRQVAREHGARADHASHRAPGPPSNIYLRVAADAGVPAQDVPGFLLVCAAAMRRAVVDYMRREGDQVAGSDLILRVDAALDVVESVNARLVRVIETRYFAGLSEDEAARALQVDTTTLRREWTRARAWTLKGLAAPAGGHAAANGAWVDAVFDDALALPEESLGPFLERCAAAPGELRARVEELLRYSSASVPRLEPGDLSPEFLWSILGAAAAPPPAAQESSSSQANALDGWRVVRELSRGRLGPLYLAERTKGEPPVRGALRFLPGHAAADLTALRVRPDWRALTSLAHPGIARVVDAGRDADGRLFVVSELVEGCPLDRYCDEELLTVEQRLELFVQVCLAVQYAHRKLAVHGGLEPSSVVVTGAGQVKVLDFGMASLLAPAPDSDSDADVPPWVPSPDYASPEQVRGEPLAVASDVYQLGLLLYLLLTGERAQTVTAPTATALREAVCTTVPVTPSHRLESAPKKNAALRRSRPGALVRKVRGDLDAIVMYALRKEPDRRYPSVSLLHSDLQRWRRRMPIWAQSNTRVYRFRKFLERRRAPVAAAAALLLIGASALPGPVTERLRASRETARVAEIEESLGGILGLRAATPGVEAPHAVERVEQAARVARSELAAEPASRARLFTQIGQAYGALGHYHPSIAILEEALALRRGHFGDDSLEVAATLEALGQSQHHSGRYDEAETSLRTAIAVRQVRLTAAHPETLSARIELGDLLHSRGQLLEAEDVLRDAVGKLRPEMAKAAFAAPVYELLPRALHTLANVLRDRGAVGESAMLYREAIAILRQAGRPGSRIAIAQVDLSRALTVGGELDRAEAEIADALPLLRRAHADDHPLIGAALREYGLLRLEQGRFDEAQALLTDAQRALEHRLGRVHPAVTRTRALLAELARRRGQLPDAVTLATAALADFGSVGLPDHPWTIDIRATLAQALIGLGRPAEAARVLDPAAAAAARLLVSYDSRVAVLQELLVRARQGRS